MIENRHCLPASRLGIEPRCPPKEDMGRMIPVAEIGMFSVFGGHCSPDGWLMKLNLSWRKIFM
jgi:hypothetical protein